MQTPQIPRAEWTRHPRFATQALLLGSHANFRRVSAQLVAQAESGNDLQRGFMFFQLWKRAMSSHEAYEERKLYPFLTRRWGVSCADAEAGHHQLGMLDVAVRTAFISGQGLVRALREHDRVLCAHLDLEEELVIPLLLALTPEEFAAYSGG